MTTRYVCIHGHFYQPPRENPWLEAVERQDSAYPNHDWNERITRECYGANAAARLLDDTGRIIQLLNNYERISFNFGPTLLSWLETNAPDTYAAILAADQTSMQRFSGHGSAMAQAYNHPILPLCNNRDRQTQIRWGIRDFVSRFRRQPEGMWLPETAVDIPTLEALAAEQIQFTVLAPRQADKVRRIGDEAWQELPGGVDSTRAYLCRLPSGRSINLFFYDGSTSQAVAFEGLLHSGEGFAQRLIRSVDDREAGPRLIHIATDGESYGHHHHHGEMALAAALEYMDKSDEVLLTNYGEFLQRHPPEMEVQIHERSSWSCVHGVGRWSADCGCVASGSGYHQRWREPLRTALDWLRDEINPAFERLTGELLDDPWAARDHYIDVILDRTEAKVDAFIARHQKRLLDADERVRVLQLMELQRHAMLMYTSCGWFFDDIERIETAQILSYAGRVVQLAQQALALELEDAFVQRLVDVPGNEAHCATAAMLYEQKVRPACVDLVRVGAHFAMTSIFENPTQQTRVYCYDVQPESERRRSAGRAKLFTGRVRITSRVTLDDALLTYAVLHFGDQFISCGVRHFRGDEQYTEAAESIENAFNRADFAQLIRLLSDVFGKTQFSMDSLFRDEQERVVNHILAPTLSQIEDQYRRIYEQHMPMVQFLKQMNLPAPKLVQTFGSAVLSRQIQQALQHYPQDTARLKELLDAAKDQGIDLDTATLSAAAELALAHAAGRAVDEPENMENLRALLELIQLVRTFPFAVDPWTAQEAFLKRLRKVAVEPGRDDQQVSLLTELADALHVKL